MTIGELLDQESFKTALSKELDEVLHAYKTRPESPKNQKYKRTWVDHLLVKGLLSENNFINEVVLILNKKSSLSTINRNSILLLFYKIVALSSNPSPTTSEGSLV